MNKRQRKKINKEYSVIYKAYIYKNCIPAPPGLPVIEAEKYRDLYDGNDILYIITKLGSYKDRRNRKQKLRNKK